MIPPGSELDHFTAILSETPVDAIIAAAGSLPAELFQLSIIWVVAPSSRDVDWHDRQDHKSAKIFVWHEIVEKHTQTDELSRDLAQGKVPKIIVIQGRKMTEIDQRVSRFLGDCI